MSTRGRNKESIPRRNQMTNMRALLLSAALCSTSTLAFAPVPRVAARPSTDLALGIPKFLLPKDEKEESSTTTSADKKKPEEKKVGWSSLFQLIAAGAGAPVLGEFQGVDEETGKFMFSLEANNLVDENGNSKQTSMPYFENGWVDENDTGFKWPWEKKDD